MLRYLLLFFLSLSPLGYYSRSLRLRPHPPHPPPFRSCFFNPSSVVTDPSTPVSCSASNSYASSSFFTIFSLIFHCFSSPLSYSISSSIFFFSVFSFTATQPTAQYQFPFSWINSFSSSFSYSSHSVFSSTLLSSAVPFPLFSYSP